MVSRVLGRYEPIIYAVLRIVVGALYLMHGTQKLFAWPIGVGGHPGATANLTSLLGAAGLIETVGGAMITVGLFANWAGFVCSGEMAFAYFLRQFPFAVLPITPSPGVFAESAVINCFFFLYVAARGAGPLSVDQLLGYGRARSIIS